MQTLRNSVILLTLCFMTSFAWCAGFSSDAQLELSASRSVYLTGTNTSVTWTARATNGSDRQGYVDLRKDSDAWQVNWFQQETQLLNGVYQVSRNTTELTGQVPNAIGKYRYQARGQIATSGNYVYSNYLDMYVLGGLDLCVRNVSEADEESKGAVIRMYTETDPALPSDATATVSVTGNANTPGEMQLTIPTSLSVWYYDETQQTWNTWSNRSITFTSNPQTKSFNLRIRGNQRTAWGAAELKAAFVPTGKSPSDCPSDIVKCTVVELQLKATERNQESETTTDLPEEHDASSVKTETVPGLFTGVNNDWDEQYSSGGTKIADNDHLGVAGEDTDLRTLAFALRSETGVTGTWNLAVPPTVLKLWESSTTEHSPNSSETAVVPNESHTLSIEGISASDHCQ